jgi:hypothetical protein
MFYEPSEGEVAVTDYNRHISQRPHPPTHSLTRTHAHTDSRTHARTHTHTRARAHTHTHTQRRPSAGPA